MAQTALGGALSGLGRGLVRRSENEREERLINERYAHDDVMRMRDEALAMAREIRGQDFQRGLQKDAREERATERREDRSDRIADSTADRVSRERENQLTRESNERIAGLRGRGRGGVDDETGMTPAEQRAWNSAKELNVTVDEYGGKTIDRAGMARDLRRAGFKDLADFAAGEPDEAGGSTGDPSLDEYGALVDEARNIARQGRPAPATGGGQGGSKAAPAGGGYDSADAVRAAFRDKKISREQALDLLRSKFGMR